MSDLAAGVDFITTRGRPWEEIVALTLDMMRNRSEVVHRMSEILVRYGGEYVIPLPKEEDEPKMPPLTPHLVGDAIDAHARRAASTRPVVMIPALDPRKDQGVRSKEYAATRRRIIAATYDKSKWLLQRRRYYMHLAAYETASLSVAPDPRAGMPKIKVRNPLTSYADPRAAENLDPPEYVAYVTQHSGEHLRRRFPATMSEKGGPITPTQADLYQNMWNVVEWIDNDVLVWGLAGPIYQQHNEYVAAGWEQAPYMELARFENRMGMCSGVVPENVTLSAIASRLASMLGTVDLQAKLMALDILAQEKAIYPDTYIIGREGQNPRLINETWQDGRSGNVNLLADVEAVGQLRNTPDQRTSQSIDRLERNFTKSQGPPPQFGGETYGALRTGRGLDALAGFAIDPRIQELHEISETWLPDLNRLIFRCYKAYWGSKQFTIFSGWPGDQGEVEFVPNQHIETEENTVTYNIAGADVVQQTQILGSLYGAGGISLRTLRAKHPYIDDPGTEEDQIRREQLEEALRQSVMAQLQSGQLPLIVSSILWKAVNDGDDMFVALEKADEELRRRQATQAEAPPEGMAAPPGAMPGLAGGPGAAMEQMPQDRIQVPNDVTAMRQLMTAMGGR